VFSLTHSLTHSDCLYAHTVVNTVFRHLIYLNVMALRWNSSFPRQTLLNFRLRKLQHDLDSLDFGDMLTKNEMGFMCIVFKVRWRRGCVVFANLHLSLRCSSHSLHSLSLPSPSLLLSHSIFLSLSLFAFSLERELSSLVD
jgi:hypothetical protein